MDKKYKISGFLLNYNHAEFVAGALSDALNQTVPFDEIVIIDDASTDNSVEVIKSIVGNNPRVRIIKNEKNLGVIATLNRGVEEAKGDYVYILSADDRYDTRIVEFCREAIDKFPGVAMIAGNAKVYVEELKRTRVFKLPFPQVVVSYSRRDLEKMARKRAFTFLGGASLMRRDAILEAGNHLPELKWHADWFLYLLVASKGGFVVVPEQFIEIRQTGGQYSAACFDWNQQKHVIKDFIRILKERYPNEYDFFSNNALLPTYDYQALLMIIKDSDLRGYLTPLLAWRLLTYKPFRLLGKMLSDEMRDKIRRFLRV